MLRSALISALSACLAVCTTLLFQHYWLSPDAVQQHVPAIPDADTDGSSRQQHATSSSDTIAPAANSIDLTQALWLGRVLLSRGEPEEAALVYRVAATTALSAHTGDAGTNRKGGEAQHGLGLALLGVGRPEEALKACLEAERLDSSLSAASLCVGVLLVEAGDTVGAVRALRGALEKAEGNLNSRVAGEGSETVDDIRGRLGGVLLDSGEVDEAISVMIDGKDGNNGNIAYHLGVAWQTKGETDKAIMSYSRAADLAPNLAAPRVNLGAQLLQSGRLPEAEMILKSAVELAHDDPPSLAAAQANLGAVFQRSGQTQEALESYAKAVESGAGRSTLMRIAKLRQDLGQLEQALEASRRAMLEDGDPLDTSPMLQVGLILESLGDIEEAADHFAQVVQLDVESVEATTHLAACQQRLGRHHEALESYLAASRLEPKNLVTYELLLTAVSEAKRATGEAPEESEGTAAVDKPDKGALREQVAEPSEQTPSMGAAETASRQQLEASADGLVANEAPPGGETVGGQEPVEEEELEQDHAAGGGDELREQDSEAEAAAAAAAAAVAAAERAGMRLPDAETGAVGLGSSKGAGPDALGASAAKVVPGGGAGASVRQDSAEMRRQSESLSKDDEGATTTRGFFGKKVPEGLKDPATAAGVPAGLDSNHEERGAEAKNGGTANTAKEGTFRPGVAEESLVMASDDNNVGVDVDRDERLGLPSGAAPLSGLGGIGEGSSVVDLQAEGDDALEEPETPPSSLPGEEEESAVPETKNDPDGGGVRAGGQEEQRPLDVPHVQVTDASPSMEETASAQPTDDTTGNDAMSTTLTGEEIEEFTGSGSGSGSVEGNEVVSTAAGDSMLVEGEGIPVSLNEDSRVAPVGDAATLGRDTVLGAVVDDAVVHEQGVGMREQVERTNEELVEGAAGDPSTAGVGLDSDILTAAAAEGGTESMLGEGPDPLSTTEAAKPDSERVSIPEDGVRNPTTSAKQGAANEANESEEVAVEGGGSATSTDASAETLMATPGPEDESSNGGEEEAVGRGTTGAGDDAAAAAAERMPDIAEAAAAGAADIETDEPASGNSSSGDEDENSVGGQATGPKSGEAVTTDEPDAVASAAADVSDAPVVVSEEDSKRARAKAKLGVAKLNQGQTKKAAALFEKAASIDPGWWGGFYYAALAHDTLRNPEAAAGALISALGIPPMEEGEVAELSALSSKVLAALGGENGPVAGALKTAMDASGLSFTAARPASKQSSPSSPDRSRTDTSARQGRGGGAGNSVGRTPGMGSSAGGERASGGGGGGGGGAASRTSLEANLADQFGAGAALGGIDGAGTRLENANKVQERRPFSGLGRGGDGSGGGVPGTGTNGGTVPGRVQRGEASPPAPGDRNGQQQDPGGSRFRDRDSGRASGDGRDAPSKPDAARRRSWGRDGPGGGEGGGDAGGGRGGAAAGRGSDAGPSFKIDSRASAEDILASMGLKTGVGLGPAGGEARTPEDLMAAGSSGADEGGGGKKKGLFGGLWNRNGKGKK